MQNQIIPVVILGNTGYGDAALINLSKITVMQRHYNAQRMKFSITEFFSKCDQIRRKLMILLVNLSDFASYFQNNKKKNDWFMIVLIQ